MAKYYVNKNAQANGDHEVHKDGCSYMPNSENRTYLGDYDSCHGAVKKAKETYPQSNGCYYCAKACHTQQGLINCISLLNQMWDNPIGNPSALWSTSATWKRGRKKNFFKKTRDFISPSFTEDKLQDLWSYQTMLVLNEVQLSSRV